MQRRNQSPDAETPWGAAPLGEMGWEEAQSPPTMRKTMIFQKKFAERKLSFPPEMQLFKMDEDLEEVYLFPEKVHPS